MNTSYERTEQKDEWLTPPEVWRPLQPFDLDPCQPISPPWHIAEKGYNQLDDGLSQEWHGFVWCNPPYGRETGKWLAKMKQHNNGIALVFARTGTKMFHENVFNADAIFFFKGRLSFYSVQGKKGGPAGADSCLIAYGEKAVERLKRSGLKGKLILL